MEKKEVRRIVKKQKAELTAQYVEEYSRKVSDIFMAQPFYRDAKAIYPYLAYNTEIVTKFIIERAWADGKRVAVPKVIADGVMEFYYIDSFHQIELGYCDIPEPKIEGLEIADDREVLILMPGLAFDRNHNRIGYGGGFYDRYLEAKQEKGTLFTKVSLAYDFQIFESLSVEAHDMKVDTVITAGEIL